MDAGSIPGIKWYMSEDNRSLTVKKEINDGLKEFTTSWDFEPSEDLVNFALDKILDMMDKEDMLIGQRNRFRKKGNWIFEIATGPPIWWYPRVEFKRPFLLRIGWLKCALSIWKSPKKENND